MGKLDGKVAAVTGGNSGLGLAIAKRFSSEGASVAILGRNSDALDSAVNEIGRDAISFVGDVRSLTDLDAFYDKISEEFGRLSFPTSMASSIKILPSIKSG